MKVYPAQKLLQRRLDAQSFKLTSQLRVGQLCVGVAVDVFGASAERQSRMEEVVR